MYIDRQRDRKREIDRYRYRCRYIDMIYRYAF